MFFPVHTHTAGSNILLRTKGCNHPSIFFYFSLSLSLSLDLFLLIVVLVDTTEALKAGEFIIARSEGIDVESKQLAPNQISALT